jgi:hypothetical protein
MEVRTTVNTMVAGDDLGVENWKAGFMLINDVKIG